MGLTCLTDGHEREADGHQQDGKPVEQRNHANEVGGVVTDIIVVRLIRGIVYLAVYQREYDHRNQDKDDQIDESPHLSLICQVIHPREGIARVGVYIFRAGSMVGW